MTQDALPSFGRRFGARGEANDAQSLTIRYRLSPLASLGMRIALLTMIVVVALSLGHPEWWDKPADPQWSHDHPFPFGLLHALPPWWRSVALAVLGVHICGAILLFLLRTSDARPDVVVDRRGVVEIGLFSRRHARWDGISHAVIRRRSRHWPDVTTPTLCFYLDPGEAPVVEGFNPLAQLLHCFGRPQLTLSIGLSDRSEAEILACLRALRPTLSVHDLV
jgi:hypothetical protein